MNGQPKQLPLEKLHTSGMGVFEEFQGWSVPTRYADDWKLEYGDLAETAGLLEFSCMTKVVVRGRDAADYLNRRLSQKVIDLGDAQARRAALLDGNGKMLSDLEVFSHAGEFLLLAPPRRNQSLAEEIEKYVFAEECFVEDITGHHVLVGMIGPKSDEILDEGGVEPLVPPCRIQVRGAGGLFGVTMLTSEFVPGGLLFMVPVEQVHELMGWLLRTVEDKGGHMAGRRAFNAWRIEHGAAWWGIDFDENAIPLEVGLRHAVHEDKGCYPGQETIARILNLGHPSKVLVQVESEGPEEFETGTTLRLPDKPKAGWITSSSYVPGREKVLSFAQVKWPHRELGTELFAGSGGRSVRIVAHAGCAASEVER